MQVFLAAPRGFCAGVVRAVDIVEIALERHGAPVYVKHEIVHNPHVVSDLESQGAVTVETVDVEAAVLMETAVLTEAVEMVQLVKDMTVQMEILTMTAAVAAVPVK